MPANFATIHSSIFGKTVYKYLKTFSLCPKPTPRMSSNTAAETPTLQLPHGTFTGAVCDGMPHGFGVLEYDSGITYKGNMKMGKKHGHGVQTFADGRRYDGEWQDGRAHGFATMIYKNGDQYGDVYIGEFEKGFMHGKGKLTYASGKVVEGMFENGVCYKDRASCLKLELEALQLEVARHSGKDIDGLSMEELKQIVSKNEENVRRVQEVIDRREAHAEVASMDEYNCPLTLDLMEDPVFAADGFTYERAAIAKVIQDAKAGGYEAKSPKTNLPLEHTFLTPNRDLKSRICSAVDRVMLGKRQRRAQDGVGIGGECKASRKS